LYFQFARYEAVPQVPLEVYKRAVTLKGIVRAVHSNGYLKVEHQPTFTMPSFLSRRKRVQPGLLDVRLAGIDVSDAGSEYLTKDMRLRSTSILFTAIRPVENNRCIDAEVFYNKSRFVQTNLNVDLVRRGFARVLPLTSDEHVEALKTNPSYSRLISKLIMSEKIADRRGLGLWTRDTWAETIASYPSILKQLILSAAITRFLISAVLVSKEMAIKGSHLSQRAIKFLVALSHSVFLILQQFVGASLKLGSTVKRRINQRLSK
uniref:TNase-like domain-containing protein n=1 Tax=Gongylonema pulchrum TaxID=637853 RepID=A0A183EAT7_9BILA